MTENKKAKRTPKCHYEHTVAESTKPICGQLNGTKTAFAQTLYTDKFESITCKRCLKSKFVKFGLECLLAKAVREQDVDAFNVALVPSLAAGIVSWKTGAAKSDNVASFEVTSDVQVADAVLAKPLTAGTIKLSPWTQGLRDAWRARYQEPANEHAADAVLDPLLKAGTVRWLTGDEKPAALTFEEVFDDKDEGFYKLLDQQKQEIAAVGQTFDYTVFAGAQGPLSGEDCRHPAQSLDAARAKLLATPPRTSLAELTAVFEACTHDELFGVFADPANLLDTSTQEGARLGQYLDQGSGTRIENKEGA